MKKFVMIVLFALIIPLAAVIIVYLCLYAPELATTASAGAEARPFLRISRSRRFCRGSRIEHCPFL